MADRHDHEFVAQDAHDDQLQRVAPAERGLEGRHDQPHEQQADQHRHHGARVLEQHVAEELHERAGTQLRGVERQQLEHGHSREVLQEQLQHERRKQRDDELFDDRRERRGREHVTQDLSRRPP